MGFQFTMHFVEQVRSATAEALGQLVGLISKPQLTSALHGLLPAILLVYVQTTPGFDDYLNSFHLSANKKP